MSRYLGVEPDPFPTRKGALHLRAAARTDRGLERRDNEDRAAFAELGDARTYEPPASTSFVVRADAPVVALVCDGMGGEAGGEVASRLAVETIMDALRTGADRERQRTAIAPRLVASIEAASARIREEARRQPMLARMGTTATLAAIVGRSVVCAQVGDSRAYLARGASLTQITHDQTVAELLRSSGARIEDVDAVVGSHVILQAVGSSATLDVAITHASLEEGDALLLCSDGLSGVVSDATIRATLAANDDPARACDELVRRALEAGGPDNVTCVVLRAGAA